VAWSWLGGAAVKGEDEKPVEPAKVYVPEDPDPLRDGLYAGYWRHVGKAVKG